MIQSRLKTGGGRMVLVIVALLFAFTALDASVEAAPILQYTGSIFEQGFSPIDNSLKIDGTVNYAVYTSAAFSTDATGILTSFVPGTLSGSLDLTNTYVYLFEVTNNGTNSQAILGFSTGRGTGATVTSWGFFKGDGFTGGGSSLGFGTLAGAIDPSSLFRTSTSVLVNWNAGIVDGGQSSLLVYTSPYGPDMFSSQINGGGYGASGPTPGAAVPEPSTILLMTLGVAGLAGFRKGFHRKGGRTMSGDKHTRRSFLIVLLLAFGLVGLGARVEAAPISDYTGNTFFPSSSPGVDGTVNYAVFTSADFSTDAAGILSSFNAGSESAALDLNNSRVYVFQVANNGTDPLPISMLITGLNGKAPTSWGYFTQTVLTDAEGNVSATNDLGPAVTSVGFATDTSAVDPTLVQVTPGVQTWDMFLNTEVSGGLTSSLLVYTADYDPTFVGATIYNGGTTSGGGVPGPGGAYETVPEPGTLLLLGSGLVGLAAWRPWRHRQ